MERISDKEKERVGRNLLLGGAFIAGAQLVLQIYTFFLLSEFKGGLINAHLLLWQGIKTWSVAGALLWYLVIYLTLIGGICVCSLLAARFFKSLFRLTESLAALMLLTLLLFYAALVVINSYHFPGSMMKLELLAGWRESGFRVPYVASVLIVLAVLVTASLEFLDGVRKRWSRGLSRRKLGWTLVLLVSVSLILIDPAGFRVARLELHDAPPESPNIILIGLDSVRHDVIKDDRLRREFLPNLGEFLEQDSTVWFKNAYTPIGRTFAAWYALLSGMEPKRSGVRYNLQQVSYAQKQATILGGFKDAGYHTIYASDEKRFSAIDESYGFDQTIGPPVGAAEWILSFLEDTPVHNFVRDTPPAKWLFPHSFGNRASYSVYKPEHFVDLVRSGIASNDHSQPLFLSIHLCISHWPYSWSASTSGPDKSNTLDYFQTLRPLDVQFGEIMQALELAGLTHHALIVVFTDHGEGLVTQSMREDHPSRRDLQSVLPRVTDFSWGHGTDLLTVAQNEILVSLQYRGITTGKTSHTDQRLTSLIDIAPTIANVAGLQSFESDGIDLALQESQLPKDRLIFMETGFDPIALNQPDLSIEDLVREGISAYEVNRYGRLQIKREYHDKILSAKKKGATDGRFVISGELGQADGASPVVMFTGVRMAEPGVIIPEADFRKHEGMQDLKDRLLQYYGDEWPVGQGAQKMNAPVAGQVTE